MMWSCPWLGYGSGGVHALFSLFWVALILVASVAVIRWLRTEAGDRTSNHLSALETLKMRYAKGEIDKKEFEEKRKDLEDTKPSDRATHDTP